MCVSVTMKRHQQKNTIDPIDTNTIDNQINQSIDTKQTQQKTGGRPGQEPGADGLHHRRLPLRPRPGVPGGVEHREAGGGVPDRDR